MAIAAMASTSFAESPLSHIAPQTLTAFCASPGFQVLRNYLENELEDEFCNEHVSNGNPERSAWLLQRDILHAMTMPVVQLFNRASTLAFAALCTTKSEDLELAFSGEARSAFLWLQCFVGEEEDWCYTRGCPACLTYQILSTDSTARFTLTSALLSSTDTSPPTSPTSLEGSPSLPDFTSVLPSLKIALDNDQFWGESYYEEFLSKSQRLASGIHEIISQCEQLEVLVSSRSTSPVRRDGLRRVVTMNVASLSSTSSSVPSLIRQASSEGDDRKEIKLKKSRLAKRQSRLKHEERELLLRMAWQCWSATAMSAEQRIATRDHSRRANRYGELGKNHKRTLTCP